MQSFQYMIGNTDWSLPGQHNVLVLKSKDPKVFTPVAVPYDFDYCGLVNPPYAIPSKLLPISDIKERLFHGPCRNFDSYRKILVLFVDKKREIYQLITNAELLTTTTKKDMIAYLDSFYKMINTKKLEIDFKNQCL